VAGARVEDGREEEGVVGLGIDFVNGGGRHGGDLGGFGLRAGEQVGRAGARGAGTVPMFPNHEQGAREDRGGGRDIERVVRVAARADNVAQAAVVGALFSTSFCDERG
jgi:hypothetical protein